MGLLGYRLSPEAAVKAHAYLEKGAKLELLVETASGPVYMFEESEGYRTLAPNHVGLLWVARTSSTTQPINDEGDAIRTLGFINLEHHGVRNSLVAFRVKEKDVAYIEAGPETERIRSRVYQGEPIILQWHSSVNLNALNAIALNDRGETCYKLDYDSLNPHILKFEDFRWRKDDF